MTENQKRGRPPLSLLVKQEKEVSRMFTEADRLRKEFEQSLTQLYPQLSSAQRDEIRQAILGVSEEYRLWSDIDNALLALQRKRGNADTERKHRQSLMENFHALNGLYVLYCVSHSLTPLLEPEQAAFEPDEIQKQLSTLSVERQSLELQKLAKWLTTAVKQVSGRSEVALLRRYIRILLKIILQQRLSLLYPHSGSSHPGRPTLPLPVRYIRAEQALINSSLNLYRQCQDNHQPMPSPKSLSIRHQEKSRAGRPALTQRQKLLRQIEKKQKQLQSLSEQKNSCNSRPLGPGRRPLSVREKTRRLKKAISQLQDQIASQTE